MFFLLKFFLIGYLFLKITYYDKINWKIKLLIDE